MRYDQYDQVTTLLADAQFLVNRPSTTDSTYVHGKPAWITPPNLSAALAAVVTAHPSGDTSGTADTAAIQAAMLTFGTLGGSSGGAGGIVLLGPGIFYVKKTLIVPAGVILAGSGWATEIALVANSGCDMVQFATYNSSSQATVLGVSAGSIANAFYSGVRDLFLHGDSFAATTPAYFHGINVTTNPVSTAAGGDPDFDPLPVIENVWIKAVTGDGYYHENGRSGAFLKRVLVEDATGLAFAVGTDTTLVDCLSTGCGGGFYLNHSSNVGTGCKSYNTYDLTWVSGHSYVATEIVVSAGVMYWCILAVSGSTAPASDPTHWTALSATAPQATGYGYYWDTNASEHCWAAVDGQCNSKGDYYFHGALAGSISVDGTSATANFNNSQPAYNSSNPNHYACVTFDGCSGVNMRLSSSKQGTGNVVICTSLNSPGSNTLIAVTDGTEAALFNGGTPSFALVNGAVQGTLTAKAGLQLTAKGTKTGAYTVTTADFLILGDATSGGFNITLPDATTCTGQLFCIKQVDTSANAVSVLPHSGQNIDGNSTWDMGAYQGLVVISDGANFRSVLAYGTTQNNELDDGHGNMFVAGSIDIANAGKGLQVKEGSNCKQGTLTLNGTTAVTVANTSVTANSRIFLTIQAPGGTPASPYVSARTAGTSFAVKSTGASDTSTVAYFITEPG